MSPLSIVPFVFGLLTALGVIRDSQYATALASAQSHSHLGSQSILSSSEITGVSIEAITIATVVVVVDVIQVSRIVVVELVEGKATVVVVASITVVATGAAVVMGITTVLTGATVVRWLITPNTNMAQVTMAATSFIAQLARSHQQPNDDKRQANNLHMVGKS